jgi:aspartate racemase
VLLTGTSFTMQNDFYKKALENNNIECIIPNNEEQRIIQNIIFPNLENGIIREEDKTIFKHICNKIIMESNIEGIILGCTELPLMIHEHDFDINVLDTTKIHVRSIIEKIQ